MTLKILIVDDEAPARSRLARLLSAIPAVEVIGEAGHGEEALQEIGRLAPDVVFLDIEMPGLDGLEVARALGGRGPQIVFATAFDDRALAAFDARAVDYLVKPIETARLHETIKRLRDRHQAPDINAALADLTKRLTNKGPRRFAVRQGQKFVVVDTSEIALARAQDHYVELTVGDRRILADDSLDELEARLDPEAFCRVHRGALLNFDFLSELRRLGDRKYLAILNDHFQSEIQISREKLSVVKARLGLS